MPSAIETHPHPLFVPDSATVLILGSFPGQNNVMVDGKDEWFYASKRNQFWSILRGVYNEELLTTKEKQSCFEKHGIAMGDIFLKIRRKENTNSDSDIEVVEYNDKAIQKVLGSCSFNHIFFTSKLVEKEFLKCFPNVKSGECLPSPSPRYAKMNLSAKIEYYKKKLPA